MPGRLGDKGLIFQASDRNTVLSGIIGSIDEFVYQ
jgi:hypothetical protein